MSDNIPPTGLSFFDGREVDDIVKLAVVDALDHARKWKAIPPPPLFTDDELAELTPPGEKTWTRDLAKTPPPPPFPDPPPERYPEEAIRAEIAMSLYRAACRLGLHVTGTEAILLAGLERAHAELAANAGFEPIGGILAAHAIAAGAMPPDATPPMMSIETDPAPPAAPERVSAVNARRRKRKKR